jgi:ribosome biogenesis GTPase
MIIYHLSTTYCIGRQLSDCSKAPGFVVCNNARFFHDCYRQPHLMSKRKLSKQQRTRIDQRQRRTVAEKPNSKGDLQEEGLGPECAGIITCHFGQQLDVESTDGPQCGQLFRCYQRSNLPALVCGDRIFYQPDSENTGVIVALQERATVFSRPAANGELRPVASNIDLVLIVIAPKPQPFQNLVDRYLVAVETMQLTPLIIINKVDLQSTNGNDEVEALKVLY